VAYGFPTDTLNYNEMYVSDSITDLLQPQNGELQIHIDASMISSGLELVKSFNEQNKEDIKTNEVIGELIDWYLESDLDTDDSSNEWSSFFFSQNTFVKNLVKENKDQIISLFQKLISTNSGNNTNQDNLKDVKFEEVYKIKQIISNPYNKWSMYYGNVVMVDYKSIQTMLKSRVLKILEEIDRRPELSLLLTNRKELVNRTFNGIDRISDIGLQANVLFKNRRELYYKSDTKSMKIIMEKIGMQMSQNYSITSPRIENMENLKMFTDMQNSSFLCVIFLLSFVSGIVVYSLMLFDIDERRYEMGMLRTLGMSKRSIVIIMLNQAFFFAIPGLIIGIILSALLYLICFIIIFSMSHAYIPCTLKTGSILYGIGFSISMPLVANIMPIRTALAGSLRESLNIIQHNLTDFKVMRIRLDKIGLSPNQLCLATALIVMGVLTYYVAPIAFLNENLYLFTLILNLVIIFMILGLSFTAQLLLPYFERWVLYGLILTFYRNSEKLKNLIVKNLRNHKIRNAKTGMMFTITLAFMIFGTCNFDNIGFLVSAGIKEAIGSDISVLKLTDLQRHDSSTFIDPTTEKKEIGLREEQLKVELDKLKEMGFVKSYSFITPELLQYIRQTQTPNNPIRYGFNLMNVKGDSVTPKIYGVDENLLSSIASEYYYPQSENPKLKYETISSGQKDAVKAMFKLTNRDIKQWKMGEFDPENILAYTSKVKSETVTETFNAIIPESLKWLLTFDAGNNNLNIASI
jgi:ABC-type antimicrobial peptide transport system permease subunit